MNKEDIMALLRRKKLKALQDKGDALEKHDHNSASNADYFAGKAAGISVALEIVGMLDID